MTKMWKSGIIDRGEERTVNGVACRVWKVEVLEYGSGLERRTVCLGVDDHLPYEVTSDYDHSRTEFWDFNAAIEVMDPVPLAPRGATGAD